jgi:hypothetical protein
MYDPTLIKKENEIFLIHKEIEMESVAKSYIKASGRASYYMRKCKNI